MLEQDLLALIKRIQEFKAEFHNVEVKEAHGGCPKKLYDTISAFSNQAGGGTIIFGLSETQGFEVTGVYNAADLQKKINEQCRQMQPVVRPLFTICSINGKAIISAEIPEIDISDKPCFYLGKGRLTGSYVRVGDSDEPMTEYEVYSYDAYRNKYQDDIRPIERVKYELLNQNALDFYMVHLKNKKPKLAEFTKNELCELLSITKNGIPTMAGIMMFGKYPQGTFPQLCITAVVVPGNEVGETGDFGERFSDNKRIDGTIPQMLEDALNFVNKNMKVKTIIDSTTGKRADKPEYPIEAVREAILNALIHRDYSIHSEGIPVQLLMFYDRLIIRNPGGLYGRIKLDQLGTIQPDTRNPVIATMMEDLGLTENRYSGIPTIRKEMQLSGLLPPIFDDNRNNFTVKFLNTPAISAPKKDLISFCNIPRTRAEISEFLGLGTSYYAMQQYILPLIQEGKLVMTIPDKPRSKYQKYVTQNRVLNGV